MPTSAILLTLLFAAGSPSAGEDATRYTARVALLGYALGAGALLGGSRRLARACWTAGWLAYVVHVVLAFHHFHHWSHEHAVEHTRAAAGFGEGIYVSHLFTLAWTADVVWWWVGPDSHARRPVWVSRVLHGFLFFMVFQGAVVFADGFARWLGLGLTDALVRGWALSSSRRSRS